MKTRSFQTACWVLTALLISPTLIAAQESKPVQLPQPQLDTGRPLMQVLKDRNSSRAFSKEKLSYAEDIRALAGQQPFVQEAAVNLVSRSFRNDAIYECCFGFSTVSADICNSDGRPAFPLIADSTPPRCLRDPIFRKEILCFSVVRSSGVFLTSIPGSPSLFFLTSPGFLQL